MSLIAWLVHVFVFVKSICKYLRLYLMEKIRYQRKRGTKGGKKGEREREYGGKKNE